MAFSKFIVLLGGVLGIVAFFLPLIAVKNSGVEGAISAFQIVKGIETAKDVVKGAAAEVAAQDPDNAQIKEATTAANDGLKAVRNVTLAVFAPAVLLTLIGVAGVVRKQFGRLAGTGSFLFGVIGLGIWAILNTAANEAAAEMTGESVKGMGMHLLMVTGACGILGGLMGLIKPERKIV
jgi:hypothetical protein